MKRSLFLLIALLFFGSSYGQEFPTSEEGFEKQYLRNIKKSRLNGVYIPSDMDDAIKELIELSPKESIEKFKRADISKVARKLHFGLGRWMVVNWNFEMGSRFSHYLKSMGVSYPDDMTEFTIVSLHHHLNDVPLDLKERAKKYAIKRKKAVDDKNAGASEIGRKKADPPKNP